MLWVGPDPRRHNEVMSHAMDEPQKSLEDLSAEERATLEAAHKRLCDAVRNDDWFLGVELKAGVDVPAHSAREMGAA